MISLVLFTVIYGNLLHFTDGSCTFPPGWDSTWIDSGHGELTFNSISITGWTVTAFTSTVTSWTCVSEDTSNNYLLFLGDQTVNLFNSQQNLFRCIKWKKITNHSYYYYARSNKEANAENMRVIGEQYLPSVTSWDTATYCNPTDGPDPGEYHVLVKKGFESDVKQWCPIPLLGTFSYTHHDGSVESCAPDSEMDVCPSWTTINIDYTKCATTQAFSQEGEVYCVNTVQSGSVYYIATYNPGTVDNTNYFQFTCYALTGNSTLVYASDSPGICENGQSPTTKASDGSGTLNLVPDSLCYGYCTFPPFWDSVWHDSGKGEITMDNSTSRITSGWTVSVNGTELRSWTCQSQDNVDNLMLFKADEFVENSDIKYNVFRCIKWTKITEYSYMYYVMHDEENDAGGERVLIDIYDPSVSSWSASSLCNYTSGPGAEEYHMLVKKGFENEVRQWCPSIMFANFTYVHNDGTTDTCAGNSDLSVCPNWTTMTFDYSKCNTIQAFSQEGVVNCINSMKSGTTYFTTVINPGNVDSNNYFRFTCLAITTDGSDVLISDSAGSCEPGQDARVKQADGSGTLILSSYEICYGSCSLPSDWESAWHDSDLGTIAFDQTKSRIAAGWPITSYNSTLSSWTCQSDNSAENLLLFKSDDLIDVTGTRYNAFRCIKWKKLTEYSYRYYIYEDLEPLANSYRVRIEEYNPEVISWNITQYCNPASGPNDGEYNILVKEGYEYAAVQWCPIQLRGTFTYVHNDGQTNTCGLDSEMTACPSWTTLQFDYSKCNTVQAFSNEGVVECVDTVRQNDVSYITVINNGTVNDVQYKQFTCYAMKQTGSLLYVSDSAGSCHPGQTPTSKQTDGSGTLILTPVYGTSCSLPTGWDSSWFDSGTDELTFTDATLSGWSVSAYGLTLSSWTCQNHDTYNGYILFLGDNVIDANGVYKNAFRCIRYTKITAYSYHYYILAEKDPIANNTRVLLENNNSSITSWGISQYCDMTSFPGAEEYNVIVKKGFESQVLQWCPIPLLGTFTYTHNDGATETCGANSKLDVCPGWTTLTFDYVKCTTEQAFSLEGVAHCVQTIRNGSTFYTTVYNPGNVNSSQHERFTCYALSLNGNLVYASDSRGSCETSQSPYVKQSDGSGTLVLTAEDGSCEFPSNWDASWYDSGMGDIIFDNATTSVPTGWSVTTQNSTVSSWTCVSQNASSNQLLFKGDYFVETSSGERYNLFRCIQWESITDYSYLYRVLTDIDSNTVERIQLDAHDPTVTSWTTADYCNPSNAPNTEEFHVLVKQGYESDVKQWCPVPLRGTFNYTHDNGTVNSCGSDSSLSVCPDWTTMTFDYTRCSTEQAFSQEGTVSCVYSISVGSTYLTSVLNTGYVDHDRYHRFTCYAITESGSNIYMSDSVGSCERNQNALAKQSDGSGILSLTLQNSCHGTCSFPTEWDSNWYDSYMGDIVLDYSKQAVISGWTVQVQDTTVTSWTCQSNDTDTNQILFLGDQQILISGVKYNVFRCIQWTKITNYSYRYFIMNDVEARAGNVRVMLEAYDPSQTTWNMSTHCNPSIGPGNEEFHMLVKQGYESNVTQWCPSILIGDFSYIHTDGSTTSCTSGSSLSVCSDWTELTFDYSKCNKVQAFSQEGRVNCVYTMFSGSTYYVSLLNSGVVDDSSYHRFTCLALTESSSTNILASDSIGSCQPGQLSNIRQTDGSGNLLLTFTDSCYGNCTFPSTWDSKWHDSGHGSLEFDITKHKISSGWPVTIYNTNLTSWTCQTENASLGEGYLLFKADRVVENSGVRYNVFRCIKWTKITDYSYYYYVLEDISHLAGGERVRLEENDPLVSGWSIGDYCRPSSGPSLEEYNVIVKEGFESNAKQWCPIPLRGKFQYTHNDGITDACSSESELDLCPEWTTLRFNYSLCSTEQAFSKEGIAYCVNTIRNGSSYYTTVLNPGDITHNNHSRFTCYAITESGSTILASDSEGRCIAGQDASSKTSDGTGTLTLTLTERCYGSCSLPVDWDGTWYDSNYDEIVFDRSLNSVTTGWTITAFASTVSSWTCQTEDTASNYLLFLGDQKINLFSLLHNAFLCVHWKKITDYSYYYYIRANKEIEANNRRVHVELYDSSVTSWDTNTYCNPTTGPGLEEYNVIVKKGYESLVKQWCPIPLLGSFSYIHNDGSTGTCGSGSHLDVCATWTTMVFNYTQCSTVQAFSSEGTVYCVQTITVGTTSYTTVLNPGTVDNVQYYRYTCLAISSSDSTVYVSDNKGSCAEGQTPTTKQTDGSGTLELTSYETCYGACTFPYGWNDTWYDSGSGDIQMNHNKHSIQSGWNINVLGTSLTSWTCMADDTANNFLLFKGDAVLEHSGEEWNVFKCIKWTKITNDSYYYYIYNDVSANASNHRVLIEKYNSSVNSFDISSYCNPTTGLGDEEYHVLVKQGSESDVKQWCPIPLLGRLSYTHNDGTTSTCQSNSELNVCSDWTTMIFDYSKCSTTQAFSQTGSVTCVHTIETGSTYYTTVLNPGFVDGASYQRYTCYAISSSGSTVYASDSAGSCESSQSPTVNQVDGSGTLTMTTDENCHGTCTFPSTWDSVWYDSGLEDIEFDYAAHSISSGWTVSLYNTNVSSWTCQSEDTQNNMFLFKANRKVYVNGIPHNVFRCIKWTKITDNSYYYYVYNDVDVNAGSERVSVETHDPSVISWDISTYCNPVSAPLIEQYRVLVKQGQEANVKQWCPIPMLGTFSYTHNDGSTGTCQSGSELSVCPSWTTMTFDYSKCSTIQAFSQEGTVQCVQTIESGGTFYTTVLNPGTVNGNSYKRFTCLAITDSSSSIQISDSAGSCETGQSSTVKQNDGSGTLVLTKLNGNCTFPSTWDGAWHDSRVGDINIDISSNQISSGWNTTLYNQTLTTWTCQAQDDVDSYFLFKSDAFVELSGIKYNVFICIRWTQITDYSYYYYQRQDINNNANSQRVYEEVYDPNVSTWDPANYCVPTNAPKVEQFHVLAKDGYDNDVKQWCPSPLLGTFYYTHDDGSTQSCGNGSVWDVCPSWTTMSIDYSKCPTIQAFSQEGYVFCVFTLLSGSTYFTSVYNPGFVDQSQYHRFTCLAVTSDSNSDDVFISDSSGSCEPDQTSTSLQTDGSGTIVLTPYSTCHGSCTFPIQWESQWYDSGMGNIDFVGPTTSVSSGWTVTAYGSTVDSWTCQADNTNDQYFLFKSDDTVEYSGVRYNIFRCIRWKKITDYSYYYYVLNDVNTDAGNIRVFIEQYDPSVTSWDIDTYCNPSNGPSTEEYHVLVKQGYESLVGQWCPPPLLGKFNYTHNDGSSTTCASDSALDVCPSWTTMTFDYTKCSTAQAFSLEGFARCVHTVSLGTTFYTSVINPGSVTNPAYDRFTCFAISRAGSEIYMSDSRGSCEAGQNATVKETDGSGTLTLGAKEYCIDRGQCSFPTNWDSDWYDSDLRELEFDSYSKSVSNGWIIQISNTTLTSWSCVTSNSASNYILFKADQLLVFNDTVYNVFRCIEYSKITDYSYYYYVKADVQTIAGGQRLYFEVHDVTKTTWSTSSICSANSPPTVEEFHVLVKKGYENNATQYCPSPLLGTFSYSHESGGLVTCSGSSYLDVCSDRTTMSFNYSLCNTEQAFSKEGTVYCISTVPSGSTYYTVVYNPGGIRDPFFYRFTCYAVSKSNGRVYLSDSKNSCNAGQTSTQVQADGSGTLILTAYETCDFPSGSNTGDSTSGSNVTTASAIGAVLGLILLVLLVIVGVCLYKKFKGKQKTSPSEESKKPTVNGENVALSIEVGEMKKPFALPPISHLPTSMVHDPTVTTTEETPSPRRKHKKKMIDPEEPLSENTTPHRKHKKKVLETEELTSDTSTPHRKHKKKVQDPEEPALENSTPHRKHKKKEVQDLTEPIQDESSPRRKHKKKSHDPTETATEDPSPRRKHKKKDDEPTTEATENTSPRQKHKKKKKHKHKDKKQDPDQSPSQPQSENPPDVIRGLETGIEDDLGEQYLTSIPQTLPPTVNQPPAATAENTPSFPVGNTES